MSRKYVVYAKRKGEKNFSEWSRADTEEKALEYCEKIRSLGFCAKVYNLKERKVVLADD
jgi:hypothetical protein